MLLNFAKDMFKIITNNLKIRFIQFKGYAQSVVKYTSNYQ